MVLCPLFQLRQHEGGVTYLLLNVLSKLNAVYIRGVQLEFGLRSLPHLGYNIYVYLFFLACSCWLYIPIPTLNRLNLSRSFSGVVVFLDFNVLLVDDLQIIVLLN